MKNNECKNPSNVVNQLKAKTEEIFNYFLNSGDGNHGNILNKHEICYNYVRMARISLLIISLISSIKVFLKLAINLC